MPVVEIFNLEKQKVGEVNLADEVFAAKVNECLLYESVKAFLATRRGGNASAKNRKEVRGGGKKPWRQKGTGRARVGSIRSPLWVGGGVTHGPKPRDFSFSIPKKARKGALVSALSLRLRQQKLLLVDKLDVADRKTKTASAILRGKLGLNGALIVDAKRNDAVEKSVRNMCGFKAVPYWGLSVYDILYHENLLMSVDAVKKIEGMILGAPAAGGSGGSPEAG